MFGCDHHLTAPGDSSVGRDFFKNIVADLSLRVGEEQNTNLHHDGSVLSRTQSGLDRIDEVELDPHFLD